MIPPVFPIKHIADVVNDGGESSLSGSFGRCSKQYRVFVLRCINEKKRIQIRQGKKNSFTEYHFAVERSQPRGLSTKNTVPFVKPFIGQTRDWKSSSMQRLRIVWNWRHDKVIHWTPPSKPKGGEYTSAQQDGEPKPQPFPMISSKQYHNLSTLNTYRTEKPTLQSAGNEIPRTFSQNQPTFLTLSLSNIPHTNHSYFQAPTR